MPFGPVINFWASIHRKYLEMPAGRLYRDVVQSYAVAKHRKQFK